MQGSDEVLDPIDWFFNIQLVRRQAASQAF
jgi:hypothetical protein